MNVVKESVSTLKIIRLRILEPAPDSIRSVEFLNLQPETGSHAHSNNPNPLTPGASSPSSHSN